MVHRRPTIRRIHKGDPVYMCFCPFTLYKQIKLGFDREYFVGSVTDEHARIYEIARKAQAAALEFIGSLGSKFRYCTISPRVNSNSSMVFAAHQAPMQTAPVT